MLRPAGALSLLCLALSACTPEPLPEDAGRPPVGDAGSELLEDGGPPDTGYPAPRDDLVPRVGRDDAVDMATWNLQFFPTVQQTPEVVADLITSLELDLVAVQEISDVAGFEELVDRLPYHSGLLSSHEYSSGTYQKVGYVYRHDLLTVTDATLLFSGSGYSFPRPPMQARVAVQGTELDFTVINLHLKAGVDAEDSERRSEAMESLRALLNQMLDGPADDDVVLLGDFNETFTHPNGLAVFSALTDDPRLRARTRAIAEAGGVSFLPSGVMLDHIVTTDSLDAELAGEVAQIPNLTAQMPTYLGTVSDHLPVVLSLPVP